MMRFVITLRACCAAGLAFIQADENEDSAKH